MVILFGLHVQEDILIDKSICILKSYFTPNKKIYIESFFNDDNQYKISIYCIKTPHKMHYKEGQVAIECHRYDKVTKKWISLLPAPLYLNAWEKNLTEFPLDEKSPVLSIETTNRKPKNSEKADDKPKKKKRK